MESPLAGHKRRDYLSWDDYFMSVAFLSSQRSKDPHTQVGACIVNPDKKIVGIGYNGFPWGCSDDDLPWTKSTELGEGASPLETKSPYVCHAEMNAIMNKNAENLKGCRIYVALFPCNECAKLVIQSGIREVVFFSDKYHDKWPYVASRRMFDLAGVKYWQHQPTQRQVVVDFESVNAFKGTVDDKQKKNKAEEVDEVGEIGNFVSVTKRPKKGKDKAAGGDAHRVGSVRNGERNGSGGELEKGSRAGQKKQRKKNKRQMQKRADAAGEKWALAGFALGFLVAVFLVLLVAVLLPAQAWVDMVQLLHSFQSSSSSSRNASETFQNILCSEAASESSNS